MSGKPRGYRPSGRNSTSDNSQKHGEAKSGNRQSLPQQATSQPFGISKSHWEQLIRQQMDEIQKLEERTTFKSAKPEAELKSAAYHKLMEFATQQPLSNLFLLIQDFAVRYDGLSKSVKNTLSSDAAQKTHKILTGFVDRLLMALVSYYFDEEQSQKAVAMLDFGFLLTNFSSALKITAKYWAYALECLFKQDNIDISVLVNLSPENSRTACELYQTQEYSEEIAHIILSDVRNWTPIRVVGTTVQYMPKMLNFTGKSVATAASSVDKFLNWFVNLLANKLPLEKLKSFMEFITRVQFSCISSSGEDRSYELSVTVASRIQKMVEQVYKNFDAQTVIEMGLQLLEYSNNHCVAFSIQEAQDTLWRKLQKPKGFVFSVTQSRLQAVETEQSARLWLEKLPILFGEDSKWFEVIYSATNSESSLLLFVKTLLQKFPNLRDIVRPKFTNLFQLLFEGNLRREQIDLFAANPHRVAYTESVVLLAGAKNPKTIADAICKTIMDFTETQEKDEKEYASMTSDKYLREVIFPYWEAYKPAYDSPITRIREFKRMRDELARHVPISIKSKFMDELYNFLVEPPISQTKGSFQFVRLRLNRLLDDIKKMSSNPGSPVFQTSSKWLFKFDQTELEKHLEVIYPQEGAKELTQRLLLASSLNSVVNVKLDELLEEFQTHVDPAHQIPKITAEQLACVATLQSRTDLKGADVNSIPVELLEFLMFVGAKNVSQPLAKFVQVSELIFKPELQNLDGETVSRLSSDLDLQTSQKLGRSLYDLAHLVKLVQKSVTQQPANMYKLLQSLLHVDAQSTHAFRDRMVLLDSVLKNKSELLEQSKNLASASKRDENFLVKFFSNFKWIVFYYDSVAQAYTPVCTKDYSAQTVEEISQALAEKSRSISVQSFKFESELDNMSFRCERALHFRGVTDGSQSTAAQPPVDESAEDEITRYTRGFLKIKQLYSACLSSLKLLRDHGAVYDISKLQNLLASDPSISGLILKPTDIQNADKHMVINMDLVALSKKPNSHCGPLSIFEKLLTRARTRHAELAEQLRTKPASWVLQFTGSQLETLAAYFVKSEPKLIDQVQSILDHAARSRVDVVQLTSGFKMSDGLNKSPLSLEILQAMPAITDQKSTGDPIKVPENLKSKVRLVGYENTSSKYWALLNFTAKNTPDFPPFHLEQFFFMSQQTNRAQIDSFLKHALTSTGKYYILDPQLLPLDIRGHFITGLCQMLQPKEAAKYPNAPNLTIICPRRDSSRIFDELDKQSSVIVPFLPNEVMLSEADNNYTTKMKMIETRLADAALTIVDSRFAGLGKTHWIQSQCVQTAPLFISGEVSTNTTEKRLDVVKQALGNAQKVGLHIKIDMMDKMVENAEIVDHMLFQIIFLRSLHYRGGYFSFSQVGNTYIELGNNFRSMILQTFDLCKLMAMRPEVKKKAFHTINKVDFDNLHFSPQLEWKYLAVVEVCDLVHESEHIFRNTFTVDQWEKIELAIERGEPVAMSEDQTLFKVDDPNRRKNLIKDLFLDAESRGKRPFSEDDATMSQLVALIQIVYHQFHMTEVNYQLQPFDVPQMQQEHIYVEIGGQIVNLGGLGGQNAENEQAELVQEVRQNLIEQIRAKSREFIWCNTPLLRRESDQAKELKKNHNGADLQKHIVSYSEILQKLPTWEKSENYHLLFSQDSLKIFYRNINEVPVEVKGIADLTKATLMNHDQFRDSPDKSQAYFALQLMEAFSIQFTEQLCDKVLKKPLQEIEAVAIAKFSADNPKPAPDSGQLPKWLQKEAAFVHKAKLKLYVQAIAEFDGGKGYSLNKDNYLKMALIYQRITGNLPVVLVGSTGCGKTYLIRFLVKFLLRENFACIVLHTGVTESDIEQFILDAIKTAKRNDCRRIWVFFDEFNTCPYQSLIEEIVVSRTCTFSPAIRKELADQDFKVPQNMVFVTACNPLRGKSKDMDVGLVHESASSFFSHRVQPIPEGMLNLAWDFGTLPLDIEKDHMRPIFRSDGISWSEQHNIIESIAVCHDFLRKHGDGTVCLRDAERVKTIYLFLKDFLGSKPSESELLINALACTLYLCYFLRIGNHKLRTQLDKELSNTAIGKFQFETSTYGAQPATLEFNVEKRFKQISTLVVEDMHNASNFSPTVSRNTPLKETIFAMLTSIFTKIPLMICGRPGTSKTLSSALVRTFLGNLTWEIRKSSQYFKRVPPAHFHVFNGSQLTTSVDILKFHKKCVESAHNHDEQALKQRQDDEANPQKDGRLKVYGTISVFLFDELGLAEIGPDNPLKVLHTLLEPEKHLIAFIGISNWKLDQSKMSRALFVARPEPQDEDLREMFNLSEITKLVPNTYVDAICAAYSRFQKNEAVEKDYQDRIRILKEQSEGTVSSELATLTEKYKYLHPDFFGLRDLYNLIKFINRHVTKLYERAQDKHPSIQSTKSEQWAGFLFRLVINGIERNFSGKKSRLADGPAENLFRSENLFKYFFADLLNKRLEAINLKTVRFSTVTELMNQNLLDDECRYLMLFTENPSINANIIDYLTSYFCQRGYDKNKVSYFSRVRSREEMDKIVQNLPSQIEQGHVLILYQTPELNSCLFEVLNNQRVKTSPGAVPSRCELQTGGDRNELVTIHPNFRVVMLMDRLNEENMSQKQPAPFLNRFEKQLVVYEDLISETRKVQQQELQTKVDALRKTEFGRRQLLLHGYNEEILHSLVLREQHENLLLQGSMDIEAYINQIVFEEQKTIVEQRTESIEEQKALVNRGLLDMIRLFSRDMLFYLEVSGSDSMYLPIGQIEEKFLETHPFECLDDIVHSFEQSSRGPMAEEQMIEIDGMNKNTGQHQIKNLLVFTTTQSYETIQLCHKHRVIVVKRVQEYEKLSPDESTAEISQLLQKLSSSQIVVFLFESRQEWSRMPELRRIVDNVKQSEAVQVVFIAHYTYQELAAPNVQVQTSITFSSRQWEQYVVEDLMGSNYRWLKENLKKPFGQVLSGLHSRFSSDEEIDFGKYTDLHLGLADIVIARIQAALPVVSYESIRDKFCKESNFFRRVIEFALDRDFPDKDSEFLSLLKKDVLLEDGSFQTLDFEVSISNWSIKNVLSRQANELLKPFLEDLLKAVPVDHLSKCLRVGGTMGIEGFKSWLNRCDKYLKALKAKKPKVKVPKQKPPGANPFLSDTESESIEEEPEEGEPISEKVDEPAMGDVEDGNSLIQAIQAFKDLLQNSSQVKQLLSEIGLLKRSKTVKMGMFKESSPEYEAALEEDKDKLVKLFKDLLQQVGNTRLADHLPDYKNLSNIDKFAISESIPAIYTQLALDEVEPCVSLLLMRLAFAYFQQMDNSNGVRDHLYGAAMVLLYEIFQADLQLVSSDIFQDEAQLKQTLDMFTKGFLLPMGANLKTLLDAPVALNQTQGGIQASLTKVEEVVALLEKSLQEQTQQQNSPSQTADPGVVDAATEKATDKLQQDLIWSKTLLKLYKHLVQKDGTAIKDFMGAVGSQQTGPAAAQMTKENFVLKSAQGLVDDKQLLSLKGQAAFVRDLLRDMLELLLLATVEPEHQDKILSVQSQFTKKTVNPKKAETLEPLIDLLSSLMIKQLGTKQDPEAVEQTINELFLSNSIDKTSEEAKILKAKVLSQVITKVESKLGKNKAVKPEALTQQLEDFKSACEFFNGLLVNTKPTDPVDVHSITKVSLLMHHLKSTVLGGNQKKNVPEEEFVLPANTAAHDKPFEDIPEAGEQENEEEGMEEPQAKQTLRVPQETTDDEDDWEDCSDDPELQEEKTIQTGETKNPVDTSAAGATIGNAVNLFKEEPTNAEPVSSEKPPKKIEWKIQEIDQILAEGIRSNNMGAVILAREIVRYLGSTEQSLVDHGLTSLAKCYREGTEHELVKLLGDRSHPEVKKVDQKIQNKDIFTQEDLPPTDWARIVRFASQVIYSDDLSLEGVFPRDNREECTWVTKILDSEHLMTSKDNYSIMVALAAFASVHSDKKTTFQTMFNKARNISAGDEQSELHNGVLIKDIMETFEKFTKPAPQDYRIDAQCEDDDDEDMREERRKKLAEIERQEADLVNIAKKFSFGSPIRSAIFKLALPKILDFVLQGLTTGQVPDDFFRSLDDQINRLMNNKRLEEFLKIATEDGSLPDVDERTRLKSLWTAMGMMDPMQSATVAPAIGTYLPFSLPSLDDLRENLVASQANPQNATLLRNVLNVLEYREVYEAHPQVLWSLKELLRLIKRKFDFKFTKEEAETLKLSSFVGEQLRGHDGDSDIFVLSAQGTHFDQEVQRAYLQFRKQWKNYLKIISQHQKFSVFKFQTKSMSETVFKEADLQKLLSTDLPIANFLLRPEQETKEDPTKQLLAAVLTNLSNMQNNLVECFGPQKSGENPLFKLQRQHLANKLGETGSVVEMCSVPEPDKQQVVTCLFGGAHHAFRTVDYKQIRLKSSADFEKYNYKGGDPVDLRNMIIKVLGDACNLKDGPENIEAYKTAVTIAMKVNVTNSDQLTAISRFLMNSLEDFQKVDGIHPETELEVVFKQPPIKIEGYKQLKLKHLVHFVTYLGRMHYTKVVQPQQKKKTPSGLKLPEVLQIDMKDWAANDMVKRLDMEITFWYYLLSLTPVEKLDSTEKLFGSNFMSNWSWYKGAPIGTKHSEKHPVLVPVSKILVANHQATDKKLVQPEKATMKGSVLAYLEGMQLIWKTLVGEKDPSK